MSESTSLKTLIIVGGGILGFVLLILLIVWITSIAKGHYVTYETLEAKMVEASKKYYSKNPTLLPAEDEETTLYYDTLVTEEYIKPLNKMLKDGDKCSAYVVISNVASNYDYAPYINCPGSYETQELYKVILKNNPVVTSGSGLYSDGDSGYYFRGEITNNYVKLGTIDDYGEEVDNLWRILSIEKDNTVKIRATKYTEDSYTWDDRYNETQENNYGYNKFEISRIKDTLANLIKEPIIMDEEYKSKLVAKKLCVGRRELEDTTKNGSAECSVMSNDKYYFGLLSPYEYMRISLDDNCKDTSSISCSNYNFLRSDQNDEWTLSATITNDYEVLSFNGTRYNLESAYMEKNIMPSAYLNTRTFFVSGTGTMSDPYIIK